MAQHDSAIQNLKKALRKLQNLQRNIVYAEREASMSSVTTQVLVLKTAIIQAMENINPKVWEDDIDNPRLDPEARTRPPGWDHRQDG